MLITLLSAAIGAAIILLVVLVALMGWAGPVNRAQRLALCAIAAGLLWAGPGRALRGPPGLGDMLFLGGVLAYGLATYGRQLRAHVDGLDGKVDGRVNIVVAGDALEAQTLETYNAMGQAIRRDINVALDDRARRRFRR